MSGTQSRKRSRWSSQIAFMLAAAASAVGLGNIWRFPYLAAKHGGGIFLFVYLILVVTFGFSLMIGEVALGRMTGLSPIEAFRKLKSRYVFIGWILTAIPLIITPYYCVIGGWVTKYLHQYVLLMSGSEGADTGLFVSNPAAYFEGFIGGAPGPILLYSVVFIFCVYGIVLLGVQKGIEMSNKIIMPLLILMSIALCIYTVTLPGAMDGIKYYLLPDFSKFSYKTVVGAMGQMFYSLSLAMGIMITYGSYMRPEDDLEGSVRRIEIFDTAVSFLAGFMIIPAVVIFFGADKINAGPGLMFETLPNIFNKMPFAVGALFFLLVLFAALTSAISLAETCVASLHDIFKLERHVACAIMFVFTVMMAIPSALGYGVWSSVKVCGMAFLDFFDFVSNNVMMPISALLTCLFIGWVIKPDVVEKEVTRCGGRFSGKWLFVVMTKYVAPALIVVIFITFAFRLKI